MKLWQKVSALCVCVLLVVVIVCSMLLLNHARDSILSINIEQTHARQSSLITAFTEMVEYYLEDDASPAVRLSGVKYSFGRFADETSVLVHDDEIIYSFVTIDPSEYLSLEPANDSKMAIEEIMDRNVLIVGSPVSLLGDMYIVYTVNDITEAYNDIALLTWRFAVICAVSVIAGTIMIILLVRHATNPLIALKIITRRIAVGEYGQRANIRTRDEIGELAADFNEMADAVQSHIAQIEDTAERRQLFIGGLTHELKTPMASMLLHTDTLLTADLSSDEAKRSLMHLHEQCRWLERLSQKLLKLITLDQEIVVQPENIKELFIDVESSTTETLKEKNIRLAIECDTEMMAIDYDLMKSLLINLLDNASKASGPGKVITLRAYDDTIEVSDSGVGIPPEEAARVTDAFYMADRSRSRKTGGSGLGLALVKRIADAHGAELVIDSELLVGTTVRVIFHDKEALTIC